MMSSLNDERNVLPKIWRPRECRDSLKTRNTRTTRTTRSTSILPPIS